MASKPIPAKKSASAPPAGKGPSPEETGLPAANDDGTPKTGGQLIKERAGQSGVPLSEADRIIRSKGAKRED
jgi:hypothetical protein